MTPSYSFGACIALVLSLTNWFGLMHLLGNRTRLSLGYDLRFMLYLWRYLRLHLWFNWGLNRWLYLGLCWARGFSLGLCHKLT